MDQFTRRIIGFAVNVGDVDGAAACRMLGKAIADAGALPKRLSSDNDPLFLYHQWTANLRILGIEELKTVPYVPLSHPFVERLVGTIRREYLDHVFFWNEVDLLRKLNEFQIYFNGHRTHASLEGSTPAELAGQANPKPVALGNYRWEPHCRGLFQLPMAA